MSTSDFDIYKQYRIATLNRVFIANVNTLYSALKINISRINASRASYKQSLINSLMTQYNNNLNALRAKLIADVDKVTAFKPTFTITAGTVKRKFALLVGINYIGTPYELSGCIEDSNNMKALLTSHGFTQFTMLNDNTSTKPTKDAILSAFKNLVTSASSGDIVLFHFSGHGSYTFDKSGDETDGRDEMIISSDLQGVIDDDFKAILSANMKEGVTLVGLFDSCHSGTMFDLKYNYLNSENYDKYTENDKASECSGNVLMISGCMDSQTSSEAEVNGKTQGAITWCFIQSINGAGADGVSWRQLLKGMRDVLKANGFDQIPQISTDSFYDIDSNVFL